MSRGYADALSTVLLVSIKHNKLEKMEVSKFLFLILTLLDMSDV